MYADTNSPLFRYFAGLAENTFQIRLGIADPLLLDYLSDLLVRFVRSDSLHRIRSVHGRPLLSLGEMASEAAERLGDSQREVHRHIGDFTLFWAGVYPESLRRSSDRFEDFCSHGKRSYLIASLIETSDEGSAPSVVLQRLSEQFELCAYGLREVRREWEDGTDDPPATGPLLLN